MWFRKRDLVLELARVLWRDTEGVRWLLAAATVGGIVGYVVRGAR